MDGDAFVYVAKSSGAIIGSRPDYIEDPRYDCLQVPEGLTVTTLMAVRSEDGAVTLVEDPAKVAQKTADQWTSVRAQQRQKLYESDWTCSVTDYEVPNKSEWAAYRQALRDVTTQTDPFAIVWPVAPSE
jgi:hypothetical protein